MENPDAILGHLMANDAWVRALAHRLVADPHVAEDVAQEAWLAALTNPPRKESATRSWLGRVVRNFVRLRRQGDANRRAREKAVARPEPGPSVTELREQERTRHKVTMAVFALEEPYRSAILMRYFENRPPREIAARLDVSVAAVESRLRRGHEKLRARLDHDFGERRSWCAALLPLAARGTAAAVGGSASASLLTGALVMSTKIKIAIAVIVAAGVTYAFWPRDGVEPPEAPKTEVRPAAPPVHLKDEAARATPVSETAATAAVVGKETAPAPTAISLEPARGTIVGRVTDQDGAAIPDAVVRALRFERLAVELPEMVSTRTDKGGRYVLEPVRARCVVEARSPRHHSERRVASPFSRVDFVLGTPGILKGQAFLAETRAPCPDVTVAVYPWQARDILELVIGGEALRYAWHRPPVARGHTDRQGAYRFANLKPGRYQLRALSSEHPEIHTRDDVIEVRAGQETVRNLAVIAGVEIVGRVTAEPTGAAISGAEVFLNQDRAKRAVTGPDGRYRLAGVAQAWPFEVLFARAHGFNCAQHVLKFTSPFARTYVHDVVLTPGVVLTGRVVGPGGVPVAGARVSQFKHCLRLLEEFAHFPIRHTTSDEQGRFTLTARPYERVPIVRLYATKEGLSWGASEPFGLKAGQGETEVEIRLGRGGMIAGRVTDEDDRPIESARVAVHEGKGSRRAAFTRADGRYEIIGIRGGTYDVKVVPPGLLAEGRSRFTSSVRRGVSVSDGGRSEVDLVLRVGPILSGRVVDGHGRPVPDVVIRAFPRQGSSGFPNCNPPIARDSVTDARGEFRVEGLWDSTTPYWLIAKSPEYASESVENVIPGRTDVLVTLRSLHALEGRVLFASTGRPVPFFQLEVWKIRAPGQVPPRRPIGAPALKRGGLVVDEEGRFNVRLGSGKYEIQARVPDGQRSKLHTVELSAGSAPGFLELRVWRAARLRGRVQTAQAKAVGSVQLCVYDLNADPVKILEREAADSEGRFEFRSLPAGNFLLVGGMDRYHGPRREGARRIELLAGSEQEVTLTISPGTPVAVTIKGKNGKPIAGAGVSIERADRVPIALRLSRMRLYDASMAAYRRAGGVMWGDAERRTASEHATRCLTVTNPEGGLTGLTLIPGDYVFQASAKGYAPCRKTVRVGSGVRHAVELVLEKE